MSEQGFRKTLKQYVELDHNISEKCKTGCLSHLLPHPFTCIIKLYVSLSSQWVTHFKMKKGMREIMKGGKICNEMRKGNRRRKERRQKLDEERTVRGKKVVFMSPCRSNFHLQITQRHRELIQPRERKLQSSLIYFNDPRLAIYKRRMTKHYNGSVC